MTLTDALLEEMGISDQRERGKLLRLVGQLNEQGSPLQPLSAKSPQVSGGSWSMHGRRARLLLKMCSVVGKFDSLFLSFMLVVFLVWLACGML